MTRYTNHEYEACTAYVLNSAGIALQGFYKLGNNRISLVAEGAKKHFETRYWGQSRQRIEQEVASWPKTDNLLGNHTDSSISVVSVAADRAADRALIRTQESWRVTTANGTTLYTEPQHAEGITTCRGRLPGHPLHEWVVVSQGLQPNFDCIGFDKVNHLDP